MAMFIACMIGACLMFLLICMAENRGYLRRIKKFGNPQIGGRASLKGRWQPPSQRTRTQQRKEPSDDS